MTAETAQIGQRKVDPGEVEQLDFAARWREFTGWRCIALAILCAAFSCFHFLVLNFVTIDEWVFRAVHVNAGAALAVIMHPAFKSSKNSRVTLLDIALAAAAIGCTIYIVVELESLIMRTGVITTTADFAVGLLGAIVVVEFARRTAGPVLPIIALIFVAYAFTGSFMSGVLHHRGFGLQNFFSFIYSQEGIFGITAAASAQYIVLFVGFAVFLQLSGAGAYFMDLSFSLFGWMRGGPAKVSVVSGIMFGTVSGSSVANVVASGTFTIPMMRKVGYPRETAAAVEAASSTGGQITPPIMGAGAFIMAEVTGIPYSEVVTAAILPCLLYYIAVYTHVDIESRRSGINGLPRAELPAIRPLLGRIMLLFPLATLLLLLVLGYSVVASGTWGIIASMLVMLLLRLDLSPSLLTVSLAIVAGMGLMAMPVAYVGTAAMGFGAVLILVVGLARKGRVALLSAARGTLRDIFNALEETTRQSLQLIAVCACAGIIVGVLGLTGLGGRFSAMILSIAGNSELLALIFAMVIALLLGMGMPTTAAYAIAASVVAPGLQRLGIEPLAAHMFVFYFAVASAITPPVALASFAASALAGSRPWLTAARAVRYGTAAFIVPFMFIYHPEILLNGTQMNIVLFTICAAAGVLALSLASEGWFAADLNWPLRIVLAVAAILFLMATFETVIAAAALTAAVGGWSLVKVRPKMTDQHMSTTTSTHLNRRRDQ